MTKDETIAHCDSQIKLLGARANIFVKMPGKWKHASTRVLCRGGPIGEVRADLCDGKHILVAFNAAAVKTYLEEQRKGRMNSDIPAI